MEFKVGQIIRINRKTYENKIRGKIGRILEVGDSFLIEFSEAIDGCHDGKGKGKAGHCWWVGKEYIGLANSWDN